MQGSSVVSSYKLGPDITQSKAVKREEVLEV